MKPQIILMDEPFSALDEPTRIDMQRLVVDLWHEVETTVFLVTHSLSEALYLGDRVWIFSRSPGTIAMEVNDTIAPSRGEDPLEIQEQPAFKDAVRALGEAFQKVAGSRVVSRQSKQ